MSFKTKAKTFGLCVFSSVKSRTSRELFRNIRTYVGYPRSGHSLIGSLLDAHPNVIIAHEMDALRFIESGCNRDQFFYLLLRNSQQFARQGRRHSGYSYEVSGQWQGRFLEIHAIGDKKGARSAMRLHDNLELLDSLKKEMAAELKFIHVIRNPYDIVTTMTQRSSRKSLETNIGIFFKLCESIRQLKSKIEPTHIFDLRIEAFIAEPKAHLERLCGFLGIDSTESYLNDCARIVFESPRKSRLDLTWRQDTIQLVQERMANFSFLNGYSFDGDGWKDPQTHVHASRPAKPLSVQIGVFMQLLPWMIAAEYMGYAS